VSWKDVSMHSEWVWMCGRSVQVVIWSVSGNGRGFSGHGARQVRLRNANSDQFGQLNTLKSTNVDTTKKNLKKIYVIRGR
jgi:hypothetical protein